MRLLLKLLCYNKAMLGLFGGKKKQTSRIKSGGLARSAMVLNTITDGIMVIDQNGNIQLTNPAAAHITGWVDTDVIGLH